MIIIAKGNTPVACYDDVSPEEALRAYADENLPGSFIADIFVNSEETATLEWENEKYYAMIYLENF